MNKVPTWGPRAGESMTPDEFAAYSQAYPIPAADPQLTAPDVGLGSFIGNRLEGARTEAALGPGLSKTPWTFGGFTGKDPYDVKAGQGGRDRQDAMIQELQRQAQGDPNSVAQLNLKNMNRAAAAQQQSLASTMRGQGAGTAMRQGLQGAQQVGRGLAAQSVMLQEQEKQMAQSLLAKMLQQSREQNLQGEYGRGYSAFETGRLADEGQLFSQRETISASADDARRKLQDMLTREGYDLASDTNAAARNKKLLEAGGTGLDYVTKSMKGRDESDEDDSDLKPPPEEWG